MSNQAMTEILAAVANGEGAADTDTVQVSLGALRALVRQEPTAVFKGAHDGRFVIDFLHGYIPPVNLALYVAPVVAWQAVPMCHHEAYQGRCIHCDAKLVGGYVEIDKMMLAAAKKQGGAE